MITTPKHQEEHYAILGEALYRLAVKWSHLRPTNHKDREKIIKQIGYCGNLVEIRKAVDQAACDLVWRRIRERQS